MTKKDEFSQKELDKMLKNSGPQAIRVYQQRLSDLENALKNDGGKLDNEKLTSLKKHKDYYEKELETLNKLTDFFHSVISKPENYPEIDFKDIQTTFLFYTQMICIEDLGITLGTQIELDKLPAVWEQMEMNKLKLLEMLNQQADKK